MEEVLCRIGIISDTHVGIQHDGGWNQPVWLGGEETLFPRLEQWRSANNVDFIIHCGDVAEPDSIEQGVRLLDSLGCPVAAVRGNHDIMQPIHYEGWRNELSGSTNTQFGDSVFENEHCDVFLLNNQWFDAKNTAQWHWEVSPVGWLNSGQLNWLDQSLSQRDDKPAIVVVHYPLGIVPPYRIPPEFKKHNLEYERTLNELFDRHERVKIVASGHFHRTSTQDLDKRLHLTTAAFSEAPFQVRVLEIAHSRLNVRTEDLHQRGDPVSPMPHKRFLNGDGKAYEVSNVSQAS